MPSFVLIFFATFAESLGLIIYSCMLSKIYWYVLKTYVVFCGLIVEEVSWGSTIPAAVSGVSHPCILLPCAVVSVCFTVGRFHWEPEEQS